MKLWTFSKLAHQHILKKHNRETLQQSSGKVTRGKNVFLLSHKRDTKVPAWPETPTSLPRLSLSGNAQTSRRHVWRSPPPCLRMSANSLILSLRDSSVSWVCQPPALVSLPSLNPNCFGKRCCRWDRGKTSAVTPPLLVLTETTDIIGTHILNEPTHTHTHIYTLSHTHNPYTSSAKASKHTNIKSLSSFQHPSPLSFFLPFGSRHQSAQVQSLWWCYPHWCHNKSGVLPLPSLLLLCSCVHAAPGIHNGRLSAQRRQTVFNSPESQCSDYSYAGTIGTGCSGTAQPLEGAGLKRRDAGERGDGAGRKSDCAGRGADPLYSSMGFRWMAAHAQAL